MTSETWASRSASRHLRRRGREWQLVPAWFDGGQWIATYNSERMIVFAPPGVGVTGAADEPAERWQRAVWYAPALPPNAPADVEVCALGFVLETVPSAFSAWAVTATQQQLRRLEWYCQGVPTPFTEQAAETSELLRRELQFEQRGGGRLIALADLAATKDKDFTAGFSALTDVEFCRLVARLLVEEWRTDIRRAQCESGYDVLVGEIDQTARYVYVDHPARAVDGAVGSNHQWPSREENCRDQIWYATPLAEGSAHCCHHGACDRQLLGARQLGRMLRANPKVAEGSVKFKLASTVNLPTAGWGYRAPCDLMGLVETAALSEARSQLRDRRALIVSGAPGTGKTTLLGILAAEALLDGFDVLPYSGQYTGPGGVGPRLIIGDDIEDPAILHDLVETVYRTDDTFLLATTSMPALAEETNCQLHIDRYSVTDRISLVYSTLCATLAAGVVCFLPDAAQLWEGTAERDDFTPGMLNRLVAQTVAPTAKRRAEPLKRIDCELGSAMELLLRRLRLSVSSAALY